MQQTPQNQSVVTAFQNIAKVVHTAQLKDQNASTATRKDIFKGLRPRKTKEKIYTK